MIKVLCHVKGELSGTFELSRVPVRDELIVYDDRVYMIEEVIHQPFVGEAKHHAAVNASILDEIPGFDPVENVFIPQQRGGWSPPSE